MARFWWMVAGLGAAMAAAPFACVVVDNGPGTGGYAAGPSDECNPVTGDGCPSDGSSCDLDSNSGLFVCYPPPNTAAVCGACDDQSTFCESGSTCVLGNDGGAGACYRYCCTNADCGDGATCDTALLANYLQPALSSDVVGLCVLSVGPACTPPATAPSGGSCVGGYQGGDGTGGGSSGGGDGGTFADGGHGGHGDAGAFGGDAGASGGDAGSSGFADGGSGDGG